MSTPSDALTRPIATMLRALDDEDLVEAAMPWLARRLSALMPSLLASPAHDTMTTGAGVGSGPGDEPARSRALDDAQVPPAPVVPVPVEAAAVSPGSPAAASTSQGARPPRPPRATSNPGADAVIAAAARRREQIRAYVVQAGPVSSSQVAAALGVGTSTVAEHLRALVGAGAIARGETGAPWATRYAGTQDAASAAAREARPGNRTTAPHATGARATRTGRDEHGAGPVAQPAPPSVADEEDEEDVDQVDDETPAPPSPVERRRPLEQLLADEADAERDARAREASSAARRASLARAVPPPTPGRSGGRLAEPPPRPRNAC